jgi:hypothetical protein
MRFCLLFISLAFILVCASCSKKPVADKTAGPLTDYVSMREEVVKRVQSGTLKPDVSGVVQLPADLQSVSSDGQVLVANDSNAGLMILFKALPLRPGETLGQLYTEHAPANAAEFSLGSRSLKVRRKVNEHWFEVSYRS